MSAASKLCARALAGLSLVLGCTPVCDQAGLRVAAEAFEAATTERRRDGITALRAACPTLPQTLVSSLVTEGLAPEAASQLIRQRLEDPAWRELVARTCRSPASDELDDLRTTCDLDRHGLLAPDTAFARQDLAVFMLYEWLLAGRVDQALAAGVARPLLASNTLAAQGVTLPQSTIDLPWGGGPEIRISTAALSVDHTELLALTRGWTAAGELVGHVSPTLRDALAGINHRGLEHAGRVGVAWPAQIAVLADRATPMATFVDTLYTASKAGFVSFELVVHDGKQLHRQPLAVPYRWFEPTDEIRDLRPLQLELVVRGDSVVASTGAMSLKTGRGAATTFTRSSTCERGSADCKDLGDLAVYTRSLKALYPSEVVATFVVDSEVTVQALVSLIDLVRGEGCRLSEAYRGQRVPDECLFWQVVVDSDPPLDHTSSTATP